MCHEESHSSIDLCSLQKAAFANLKFWSGLATALMLLVFNHHCNPAHHTDCDPYSSIASPVEQIIIGV